MSGWVEGVGENVGEVWSADGGAWDEIAGGSIVPEEDDHRGIGGWSDGVGRKMESDVKRGIRMFDKLKVNIIGLIDNMSHFIGDDGKKYAIFGENGVERTAKEFEKKFLGQIPINADIGKYGDMGIPIVEKDPDHQITKIYLEFAKKIKESYL